MSNLEVRERVYQDSESVASKYSFYDCDNPIVLFDSTSISSTGQQSFSQDISYFRILVFCGLTSGAGWKVVALPRIAFTSATTNNYVIIAQSISDTNRRIHIEYVDSTHFNIGYTQNTARLVIYGIK